MRSSPLIHIPHDRGRSCFLSSTFVVGLPPPSMHTASSGPDQQDIVKMCSRGWTDANTQADLRWAAVESMIARAVSLKSAVKVACFMLFRHVSDKAGDWRGPAYQISDCIRMTVCSARQRLVNPGTEALMACSYMYEVTKSRHDATLRLGRGPRGDERKWRMAMTPHWMMRWT